MAWITIKKRPSHRTKKGEHLRVRLRMSNLHLSLSPLQTIVIFLCWNSYHFSLYFMHFRYYILVLSLFPRAIILLLFNYSLFLKCSLVYSLLLFISPWVSRSLGTYCYDNPSNDKLLLNFLLAIMTRIHCFILEFEYHSIFISVVKAKSKQVSIIYRKIMIQHLNVNNWTSEFEAPLTWRLDLSWEAIENATSHDESACYTNLSNFL